MTTDEVILDYSDQTIVELAEMIQGACFVVGQESGREQMRRRCIEFIRNRAGRSFAENKDNEAGLYRDLANDLEHETVFDDEIVTINRQRERAAFEELDKRSTLLSGQQRP